MQASLKLSTNPGLHWTRELFYQNLAKDLSEIVDLSPETAERNTFLPTVSFSNGKNEVREVFHTMTY